MSEESVMRNRWRGPGESSIISHLLYVACVLAILLCAGLITTVGLGADGFDPDEYNELQRIEWDLASYLSSWPGRLIPRMQHWAAWHLFDGDLAGRRLVALLAGLLNTLVVVVLLSVRCRNHLSIALLSGVLLVFNVQLLRFSRWAFPQYTEYTLCTTIFFFLLWHVLRRGGARGLRLPIVIVSLITPLTYFATVLPFAMGLAFVAAYRFLASSPRTIRNLAAVLWDLRFFTFALPGYAFAYATEMFDTAGARPTLHADLFPLSGYPQTIGGALSFSVDQTEKLFHMLLGVGTGLPRLEFARADADTAITSAALGLVVAGFVGCLWRFREGVDRIFPVGILVSYWLPIFVLGLLGQYPYGQARYALHLILPMLVLAGYGWVELTSLVGRFAAALVPRFAAMRRDWLANVGYAVFLVTLLVVGVDRAIYYQGQRAAQDEARGALLRFVQNNRPDLVLYDHNCLYWMRILAPELLERSVNMGYSSKGWRKGTPDRELAERLREFPPRFASILICSRGPFLIQYYPGYAALFRGGNYVLESQRRAGRWRAARWVAAETPRPALTNRYGISNAQLEDDGTLRVYGWVLSPRAVDRIVIRMDGRVIGEADFPQRRPDVHRKHPEYLTDHCGFRFEKRVETATGAAPVRGAFRLEVYSSDERIVDAPIRIRKDAGAATSKGGESVA